MTTPERDVDLSVVLSPESSSDERGDAVSRLMIESWKRGWDECAAAYTVALTTAGVDLSTVADLREPVH